MAPEIIVCKFFVKGNCKSGDACRFSHSASSARKQTRPKMIRHQAIVQKAMKDARNLIVTLHSTSDTQARPQESVKIQNYQFLASYNWKDTEYPTIYVPGAPPKWTPPTVPCRLSKDVDKTMIDQRTHRIPAPAFNPLFKTLLTVQPNFNMGIISLVTDRNGLRKLLGFTSNQCKDSWRMDVDLIGDTMFFSRWEPNFSNLVSGATGPGFGHAFEKTFTMWESGLEDSMSHHQIARYEMGGLQLLLVFEVDAYVDDAIVVGSASTAPANPDISAALESMSIDSAPSTPSPANEVNVILRGTPVLTESLVELKCWKVGKRGQSVSRSIVPQLWLSQTYNLFVGHHKDGLISQPIECQDMRSSMDKWEIDNAMNLAELVRVITEIKRAVKDSKGVGENGHKQCMLVFERGVGLRLFERKGKGLVLGEGVKERCWKGREG